MRDLGEDAVAVNTAVAALAGRDLTVMTGQEGVDLLEQLCTAMNTLNAVRLAALSVVHESGVWGLDGSRSAAAWLARLEGGTVRDAGGDLRAANALREHLPLTVAALADGRLPMGHAKALTQVCLRTERLREQLADPEHGEGFLLGFTHLPLGQFRQVLGRWVNQADPLAADPSTATTRATATSSCPRPLGGSKLDGFLDPVTAEAVLVALKAEIGVPAASDPRRTGRRMHDALASLAARALDGGGLGVLASVRPRSWSTSTTTPSRRARTPRDGPAGAAGDRGRGHPP